MGNLALAVNDSTLNKIEAQKFLNQLDPAAKGFTFQTFDDLKGRKNPSLTRELHGTLDEQDRKSTRLNSSH